MNNVKHAYIKSLNKIIKLIENKKSIKTSSLKLNNTILIIIDLVDDFVKRGILSNTNLYDFNIKILKFLEYYNRKRNKG